MQNTCSIGVSLHTFSIRRVAILVAYLDGGATIFLYKTVFRPILKLSYEFLYQKIRVSVVQQHYIHRQLLHRHNTGVHRVSKEIYVIQTKEG